MLAICLEVIQAGSVFLGPHQFMQVCYELALKIPSLVQKDFLQQPVMDS